MNAREDELRLLTQVITRNAKVARAFRRQYEAMTWRAVEGAVQRDPDGVAEYVSLALFALSQLNERAVPDDG